MYVRTRIILTPQNFLYVKKQIFWPNKNIFLLIVH